MFNIKAINILCGMGELTRIINQSEDIRTERSITQTRNKGNLSCPRAIVTALTYIPSLTYQFPHKRYNLSSRVVKTGCRAYWICYERYESSLVRSAKRVSHVRIFLNVEDLLELRIDVHMGTPGEGGRKRRVKRIEKGRIKNNPSKLLFNLWLNES